jgi:hypothetical protein
MSRRCNCRALGEMLHDARLRLVPLSARGLFAGLLTVMMETQETGVFKFGNRIGTGADIAAVLGLKPDDETQVETQIETLLEIGLLRRLESGALALPESAMEAGRGTAARQNGGLGGRPRRGETADQARARRAQGTLLMPVTGGLQNPETQQETQNQTGGPETPRAHAGFAKQEEAKQAAAGETDFVQLGAELAELAGMDNARGSFTFGIVKTWLSRGVTPDLLRDLIGRRCERPGYQAPRSLGYFDALVSEALAAAPVPPAIVTPTNMAAVAAYKAWKADGAIGYPPSLPAAGCAA